MSEQTIAVHLPQPLYRQLTHLVKLTQRPLESLVIEALDENIPPSLDDLPETIQRDLANLKGLSDDELWEIANSTIDAKQNEKLDSCEMNIFQI